MTKPSGFVEALRAELVAAAEREVAARRRRRRHRRLAAGASALTALLVALLVVIPRPTSAAADVVVKVRNGRVIVTLEELEHRAARIEAAVRKAGLDVTVRAVPVGPSNVGRFVGQESTGPMPPELEPLDPEAGTFRGFVLPSGWPGTLHLLVGSPARDHQRYAVFSDAFAPGEALACQHLVGEPMATAAPRLFAQKIEVRFKTIDDAPAAVLAPSEAVAPRWARWVVLGADAIGSRSVVVRIGPKGPSDAPERAPAPARIGSSQCHS